MQKKVVAVSLFLVIGIILVACGPSEAKRNAQATAIAASSFATQTAQAPAPTSTPTIPPAATPTVPLTSLPTVTKENIVHRIGVRVIDGVGEFYNLASGEKFIPRGNNYIHLASQKDAFSEQMIFYHGVFNVGVYDPSQIEQALHKMYLDGYNVVRVFLNPMCRDGCIGNTEGGLSSAYIANVIDFLKKAKTYNIFVLLTTDDTPKVGGYPELLYADCCSIFDWPNIHYLTPGGLEANRRFWQDFINELKVQEAPLDAIFAYELINELSFEKTSPPLSLTSGNITTVNGRTYDMSKPDDKKRMMDENLVYWLDQVRTAILQEDPTALVTVGFFVPQEPNPVRIGDSRVIRTRPAIWESSLDFIDLHPYPGFELNLAQHVENFEMQDFTQKPIIMGEYGAFKFVYHSAIEAARALQSWQSESCQFGFDGWLLWTWDKEDSEIWNGLDQDEVINRALAPNTRQDPCAPA